MTSDLVIGQQRPERAGIWFLGLVTVYFVAQSLLRIFTATSLSLDEAEMLVVTQELAWGYGASQPPLYGWLMLAAFKLFGAGIPALAITKNLLLWTTFVVMFLSGRMVLGSDLKAALTSAALISVPQIGWKAQFDLTHSVLALTMAALTFYVFLRLLRNGRWLDYAALGVCFALGFLSKYNYGIFAVALLVAAATIVPFRRRIFSARMLLAAGLCLLLLTPHLHWLWSHPTLALSRVTKLGIAKGHSVLSASGATLRALAKTLISCALLPSALLAVIALLPVRRAQPSASAVPAAEWLEAKQLVLHMLAVSFAFALVLVVASRSTTLRDHWFMPLMMLFPMGFFIVLERWFSARRMQALGIASGSLALASFVVLAVMHYFPDLGGPTRAAAPYGAMAEGIRKLGFNTGYILADTTYAAGNLKLRFPNNPVAEVEYGFSRPPGGDANPVLVAWPGDRPQMPSRLKDLWLSFCGNAETSRPATPIVAPYEHSRSTYRLNVVVQPRCTAKSQ